MRDNEYFKSLRDVQLTPGANKAYWAWARGCVENLNFPVHVGYIWEDELPDFLMTIEAGGFKKLGYYSTSTQAFETISYFVRAGWKVTEVFIVDDYSKECLLLEKE